MAPVFRLAHLTDPHVGPLPRMMVRQLLNKRLTGWLNWRGNRAKLHDMQLLAALIADMKEQGPDHIACTGDIVNLGLADEWPSAKAFLEGLGDAQDVSFVPGNHDAYVPGALEGLMRAVAPFATGDGETREHFPYLRRRGAIALIGLSSAIPTLPFIASGRLGRSQIRKTQEMLADLRNERDCFRIVMIHHPPHVGGASPGRTLTDAQAFEAMIREVGAELILHGHNHIGTLAYLPGPNSSVPVVGAPSASASGGTQTHRAGYHFFTVKQGETGFVLTGQARGIGEDGAMRPLSPLSFTKTLL